MRRRTFLLAALLNRYALSLWAQDVILPGKPGSVRFVAIGDMGTGEVAEYQIAQRMLQFHQQFPFTFVIALGDNIYGRQEPRRVTEEVRDPV